MNPGNLDILGILRTLKEHDVDFIIVGGISAVLQGSSLSTFDIDIVHSRTPDNIGKLLIALEEMSSYYRGHIDKKLRPDEKNLASDGHNLLLTRLGPLDVLGTIGKEKLDYGDLVKYSSELDVSGLRLKVLNLDKLIEVKESLGFEKDRAVLPILKRTLLEKSKK